MKKFVLLSLGLLVSLSSSVAQVVRLQYETSPQVNYAADVLKKSLTKNGYIINDNSSPDYTISLKLNATSLGKEAYALVVEGKT